MTIRNLEIFAEVCRQMNMSKAAQNLMISQSSVSQAVTALEKEYQVTLFERLNHSLYLTKAGEQMFYLSAQVLKNIERLELKMRDRSLQNTLNLGVCTTVAGCLLHPLLEAYRKQHEDTRFLVEMNNSKYLEERILTARLDLAVVQKTNVSSYLEYIPILEDRLEIVCWKDHPLAGKEVGLEELQNEEFIGREKGSGTEHLLESAFAGQGLTLKTGWICNNAPAAKQAVSHRAGLALLSRFLVEKELAEHKLGSIQVKGFSFSRQFDLVFHKDKIRDLCFRQFVDFCIGLGTDGMERLIV